jgi:protein-disulfide isomerase
LLAGCLGDGSVSAGSDNVAVRGDPNADITLEVYEDFLCPACQNYYTQTFPAVDEQYLEPELVRYEHRDFPFLGPESWQAASAARAVKNEYDVEEFWTYKATLMERGGSIESDAPDIFGTIAAELELDGNTIQSAASERTYETESEADKARGEDLGGSAIP